MENKNIQISRKAGGTTIQMIREDIEKYEDAIREAESALAEAERELEEALQVSCEGIKEGETEMDNTENMVGIESGARIHVMGCAAVVVSAFRLEDWKLVEKYAPDALTIADEDGNTLFRVSTGEGSGRLTKDRAEFGVPLTQDGRATITIILDPDCDDMHGLVRDYLSGPLMDLIDLEKEMPALKEKVLKMLKESESHISCL